MMYDYSKLSLMDSSLDTPTLLTSNAGSSLGSAASTASTASSMSSMMSYAGPVMGAIGAISSGIGAYFSAESTKNNLKYQQAYNANNMRFASDMSAINSRMAEQTAQSILDAGNKQIGATTLRAGKVKSSQRASQAARGIVAGEGNAAEEIATTDLMKETDALTINANAVRQAWAARTQGVNYANDAMLKAANAGMSNPSADSINPLAAGATSLINGATSVASSWYQNRKLERLSALLGGE